ncbi:MAG: DUF2088 domain-containing protein [Calditrichaeota bacterium]|nr:MAG: DUF2088 domain-containing protein [Calditrichota bacterium]
MKGSKGTIKLPWNAWYQDTTFSIPCPDEWEVDVFGLTARTPIGAERLKQEAVKLEERLREKKISSVAIAIDDLTRPMGYHIFFETFFSELDKWSNPPDVNIIVGLGTHRPLEEQELKMKVGNAPFRYPQFVKVLNHDYKNDVIPTGLEWGKIPVKVNRYFMEAQFRVIFSAIVPHPFAGFSGGPKMVLPGLSNIEVTKRTHQMALMGFVGKIGNVKENKFRKIIDEFIEQIRVDYFVGFLTGDNRECIYMKSGSLLDTYYSLTEEARKIYSSPPPESLYDVVWLNAYPKDTELLQIDTAFNPVLSTSEKFWHDESIFVVSASCVKGMGVHDLFGPGGLLYRPPREKRNLKGHPIYFLIPGMTEEQFYKVFWEGYPLFTSTEDLLAAIQERFKNSTLKIAVFPMSSIQLVSGNGAN